MFFIFALATVVISFFALFAIIFFVAGPAGILKINGETATTRQIFITCVCSGAYLAFYFALMYAMWG